jgi:hypothetical protein
VHSRIFSNKQLKYHTHPSTMMSYSSASAFLLLIATLSFPRSTALVAPHPEARHSVSLASSAKNANGVPYGESDPKIKCAFFRAFNPRTEKYTEFREDVDKAGLDPDMIDGSGWPMIFIQQGARKSLLGGAGLDTSDLDGYVDGVLSHQDLMWPHRAEIADLLEKKQDASGIITVADLYAAKEFTSNKYDMTVSFGSFNEIPLIFLLCGGDADTGKVELSGVLEFFDGKPPTKRGRISSVNQKKVKAMTPNAPGPNLFTASKDKVGIFKFLLGATGLQGLMKRLVLKEK